jgi:7-cyano-7-deazaguanine reductase
MTNTADQSPLGKTSAYRTDYAPELLFPIPRQGKRDELGLSGTCRSSASISGTPTKSPG